jgi:predicted DNA-binding transcriptional regulator YafY
MPSGNVQKLKILYLMRIFRTETDPDHGLTMPQLVERLAERGVTAERKSLYRDIETLQDFGMDIRKLKRQPVQYALVERDFELSQLTLLVDAVQSSRFLSEGASKALVKSVRQMASVEERKTLNRQVHVHGRPARQDQSDFVAVDKLQEALARRRQVSFVYYRYGADKKKVARKDGALHLVTPINLTYSDGNYYLVAYRPLSEEERAMGKPDEVRNYRVDRMGSIKVTDVPVERNEVISAYDPDEAARTAFGMYGGPRVTAKIKVAATVMNVVIDRFGRDVVATPVDDGAAAIVTVPIRQSPVFYGWLAVLGEDAEILSPDGLREGYVDWLARTLVRYGAQA